eukprot:jgi/Psemu1/205495/e_gw1.378.64.1
MHVHQPPDLRPVESSSSAAAAAVSGQATTPSSKRSVLVLTKENEILDEVRQEFNDRYKVTGKINGKKLLEKGLHSFGSIDNTALRILDASRANRPFVMAFSGYSITVGRGNFYNQSFPFVAGDILKKPMRELFDIPLVVRNAAIGGIPSFPYGFCLDHFLGSDPDVISWDYSMNEKAKDASVLEAFLRQATKQLPKRPMVIMMDTNANRMRTLDEYTHEGWLKDAIAVANKDILKGMNIFGGDEDALPAGFQKWDEFGAPQRCPGRGSWHPKKQEHAMMGWMIAMHFIEAMERAIELSQGRNHGALSLDMPKIGDPLSKSLPVNDPEVTELLFGHRDETNDEYEIKDLSCRTSFLPATDHEKTLTSVVVSGLAEQDLDIMIDRTDDHYKEGWVLDVSKVERDTKRKVERCGGLGYVDMKIAMYGVPDSGKLRLWLPFEGPLHDHAHHEHGGNDDIDTNAKHWFDDVIICEANDKRDDKACQLNRDLEIVVGGVPVASENLNMLMDAAEYLKRPTCVNVGVPKAAKVTTLSDLRTVEGQPLSEDEKKRFGRSYGDDAFGLVVDVTAKSRVTRANGACCLSHIVWEQH